MIKPIRILILLLLISNGIQNAQQDKINQKIYTVVIMPFLDELHYPYNTDWIREAFIKAFYEKGFAVILDDSTWSKILDQGFNPARTLSDEAFLVSKSIDVDLIVYGQISNMYRQRGNYYTSNPISVTIYDARKKETVIKERMAYTERWGLFRKNLSTDEMALKVVNQLVSMGYK
ncbi:MAG TPA: hypothetical protein PLZ15_00820 [Melioribacteraceae bacterium]|nr:hypothetical protein [Melioribacteraceae bacterium]